MVLDGVQGPIEPTCLPLPALTALPYWILIPHLLTTPWNPFPLVVAIASTNWPSFKMSLAFTSLPNNSNAVFNFSSGFAPPIPHSNMSGFFLGTLVTFGLVWTKTLISSVLSNTPCIFAIASDLLYSLGREIFL